MRYPRPLGEGEGEGNNIAKAIVTAVFPKLRVQGYQRSYCQSPFQGRRPDALCACLFERPSHHAGLLCLIDDLDDFGLGRG